MNSFPPPYSRGDNTFAIIGSVRFATSLPAKKWFGLVRYFAPVVFPAIPETARLSDSLSSEVSGGFAHCQVASQYLDERDGEKVFAVYLDNLRQALKRNTLVKDCSAEISCWEIEVLVPDSAALEGTRSITHSLYIDLKSVRHAVESVKQSVATDQRVALVRASAAETTDAEPMPLFGEQCWLTREHIEIEFIDFDEEADYDEASDEYKTRRVLLKRAAFADALEITARQLGEQIAKIKAVIVA